MTGFHTFQIRFLQVAPHQVSLNASKKEPFSFFLFSAIFSHWRREYLTDPVLCSGADYADTLICSTNDF